MKTKAFSLDVMENSLKTIKNGCLKPKTIKNGCLKPKTVKNGLNR
jgi:hypothetical protein